MEISVQDSGPGIAPADAERVFEPFVRLDAGAGRKEPAGSGLGLAIARSIVAAHGGTLTLDSAPGAGSRFTIRLPALLRKISSRFSSGLSSSASMLLASECGARRGPRHGAGPGEPERLPTRRGERSMSTKLRRRGWIAAGLAVLTGTALVALAPQLGFSRTGPAKLWSGRAAQGLEPDRDRPGLGDPRQDPEARRGQRQHEANRVGPVAPAGDGSATIPSPVLPAVRAPSPTRCGASARGSSSIADGYIVSNNHVVDGASEIRVRLSDGRELRRARCSGAIPKTDLVAPEDRGDRAADDPDRRLRARSRSASPVMAIGNPFGLEQTVTTGIVSGTGPRDRRRPVR